MWTSTAASGFGDRMIQLGAWALLGGMITGADSTAIQASTQFFFYAPYILISIPGGWLADKLPRKWLLLGCDETRGLLLISSFFVLGWYASGGGGDPQAGAAIARDAPGWVWLALALVGSCAAVFNPTRNAIIPQIIPRPSLQAGNAVILVIAVVASLVGMKAGDWIIKADEAASVRTGLLVGALLYLISGLFFAFLRPIAAVGSRPARPKRSFFQATAYCFSHKRILVLIAVGCLVWSAAVAVSSGVPGVVKWHFGLEGEALKRAFVNLSVVLGAGMLVGAGLVILIRTRRESQSVLNAALLAAGTGVVVFVSSPWMPLAYAAAFFIGVFGNTVIISVLTMLQSISPNYIRGRVMGFNSMANTIFSVCTSLMIWQMPNADTGIVTLLWALGPALMLTGAVGLFRYLRAGPQASATLNFFWHVNRLFCLVWHRVEFVGKHHVPHTGGVILASNHTTALDPNLIQAACNRPIRWLMLKSHLHKPLMPLWNAIKPVALDKDSSDSNKLRTVAQALRHGEIVAIFPEGGLQRRVRQLQPFEPGAAVMARLGKAVIVPVWVEGTPLADGMVRQLLQPSHSRVTFGEPIPPDPKAEPDAVMDELRQRMLALREQGPSR